MTRRLLLAALCLAFACPLSAAKGAKRAPKAAVPAFDDLNLADWRRQPFSDHASHGVLIRREAGFLGWSLRSAFAFGSQAAAPHPAKGLLDLALELQVEGEAQPRFAAQGVTLNSYPRWAEESAQDGPLRAEAVTVFSGEDVVVAAANIKNTSKQALRLRPRLRIQRRREGLQAKVLQRNAEPALLFSLDRAAAVGRPLLEHVALRLGGQSGRTSWVQASSLKPLSPGQAQALEDGQALDLELTWPAPQLLAPGQTLRVPLLLAWGLDADAVQKQAALHWRDHALPVGKAWGQAKARWAATKRRLPLVAPERQRLMGRAALDLLMADYAPRQGLNADQFSAQKGYRDAFFSVDAPLAALGWAELDLDRAQGSLLELSAFSAAAPAPLPPYSGEEKLAWEAAGLPLHALVAWELYHRDPQAPRAGAFLGRFGERLRNECAWWPGARDGDGNGLYAFARDEEMPPYLLRKPILPIFDASASSPTAALPSLQTWSLALSSLVAWQMQAASALAGAAGNQPEAERWLDQSQKIRRALQAEAWDPQAQTYRQGIEALWLLMLGLEDSPERWQSWFEKTLNPTLSVGEKPWIEQGFETPWRFYFLARTLASYGYFELERELTDRFLNEIDKKPCLDYEYSSDLDKSVGGSAATAAIITQLLLGRQEQDVYLTEKTAEFSAPMVQFRTIDGNFYLKRNRLPEKKAKYADIKVETPSHGPILAEKTFIFSSDEPLAIQIQSEWPMDISDLNRKGALIFKQSRRVELLVQPRTRIQVRFFSK